MDVTATQANPTSPIPGDKPKKVTKPEGWWDCRSISDGGSLAGVTAAIEANADIPEHWKTALKAELALRVKGDFNFAYVDAQCMVQALDAKDSPGKLVLHIDITPDKKLL